MHLDQLWAGLKTGLGMAPGTPDHFSTGDAVLGAALLLGLASLLFLGNKLFAGILTLRALALTPLLARHLSKLVKAHDYLGNDFFRADGAEMIWVDQRRKALDRLAEHFRLRYQKSRVWGDAVRESFSDLRFTDTNRVPFPFVRLMRERFNLSTVVTQSKGPNLLDLDGHWSLDVSGSYGVNVAGFDQYKVWMTRGLERVKDLGPVLGPLHPMVAENINLLKTISGKDEVSFHMSGTEAVMAAVRLARFNTRRKLIVCFSGAYHGWWDGVLPGLGSERALDDCLVLKDLSPASLAVIRWRAREIAGVLINPIQSFHPNSSPPNDAVLLTSTVRKTRDAAGQYGQWLRQLRILCTAYEVPLIFDEVYTGFRLAPGGGQEYFGVPADMVVYGKTVAGGMPIGAVCGTKTLMRRFDPERPMRLAYVVGTFSAHPVVMGAMNEFLRWAVQPETAQRYQETNLRSADWMQSTNQALIDAGLPLRVMHLGTVWTVIFKEPSRYNWLLQYYLRAEGLILSWVGTGRCLLSMDFTSEDYARLRHMLLNAAQKMKLDGWWLTKEQHPAREKHMRTRLIVEMLGSLLQAPRPLRVFYAEVMQRKHDDHHASHSNSINQWLHLFSSSLFLYCYGLAFFDLTTAMYLGLFSLFVRQFGHAILEPPCHDKETLLLGFNTRNKTVIVLGYLLIPVGHLVRAGGWTSAILTSMIPAVAWQWFLWTLLVVGGRVVYLIWKHNFRSSMLWLAKLVTDPMTDIGAYFPRRLLRTAK